MGNKTSLEDKEMQLMIKINDIVYLDINIKQNTTITLANKGDSINENDVKRGKNREWRDIYVFESDN